MKNRLLPGVRLLGHAALAVILLAMAACATTQAPPTQEIQAAEQAIATAEQDRVAEYAALEMNEARTKLAAARSEVEKDNMAQAERLAKEARVSAELASAITTAARAQEANQEIIDSTEAMKEEMRRRTGERL